MSIGNQARSFWQNILCGNKIVHSCQFLVNIEHFTKSLFLNVKMKMVWICKVRPVFGRNKVPNQRWYNLWIMLVRSLWKTITAVHANVAQCLLISIRHPAQEWDVSIATLYVFLFRIYILMKTHWLDNFFSNFRSIMKRCSKINQVVSIANWRKFFEAASFRAYKIHIININIMHF